MSCGRAILLLIYMNLSFNRLYDVHKLWHTLWINNGTLVFTSTWTIAPGVHKSCPIYLSPNIYYRVQHLNWNRTKVHSNGVSIKQKIKPKLLKNKTFRGLTKLHIVLFSVWLNYVIYFSRNTGIRHWPDKLFHAKCGENIPLLSMDFLRYDLSLDALLACEMRIRTVIWKTVGLQ